MSDIVPLENSMPIHLSVITLLGKPIFPGVFLPVMLSDKDDLEALEYAEANGGFIALLLAKDPAEEPLNSKSFYKIGVVAKIMKKINNADGGVNIFISTIKRFKIAKFLNTKSPFQVAVKYIDDSIKTDDELKALTRSLLNEMKSISKNNPFFNEEMRLNMVNIDQPGKIADFVTSILNIEREKQQDILETINVKDRINKALMFIKKEQEVQKIQRKVSEQLNDRIEKSQREYFLREELKAIKTELGEGDGKNGDYKKFSDAISKLNLTGEAKEQVERELEKFSMLEPNNSEYGVTRNYLETIIALPWKLEDEKPIDLTKAQKILDEDHYGLEDVKERIVEYLAVRKLKSDAKGSIICLVGPPGVGKTSIGKSIARSLNRPFFRFSVGGMKDEAEIKGHRRTYVGAMSGKILQGLKITKSLRPLFMIDEIDKMASSYSGDPASAMLEVLDVEQNHSFRDHYLDLPFDLSNVVFVVTANTLDTIPAPLLDRMEVIRIAGYTEDEKVEIAKNYIVPKSMQKHGIAKNQLKFDKTALKEIASGYAREAGMRNFEKHIDNICRKVAKKIAINASEELPKIITSSNLVNYLKHPIFTNETKHITTYGMAMGLAWTNFGGDTLTIESVGIPTKESPSFKLTGQMGDVMKESASIAYTFAKLYLARKDAGNDFFDKHHIHLHIPAGATPKDGPSAGTTMATALISLATKKQFPNDFAMTGELSLVGNVLPIGGLKEKSLAAKRMGLKHIIIPKHNEKDLDEIGDNIKNGLTYHSVEKFDDIMKIIF